MCIDYERIDVDSLPIDEKTKKILKNMNIFNAKSLINMDIKKLKRIFSVLLTRNEFIRLYKLVGFLVKIKEIFGSDILESRHLKNHIYIVLNSLLNDIRMLK